jgi:hypothetical protein
MQMKLEYFLYEYLTNFMDFTPTEQLREAVNAWVYQGAIPNDDFPKSWATGRRFEEECKRGTEYFLKHNIDKLETL